MFLTGEFSKIARVSRRSLHYYDEIGLLKPAVIDPETGYRYYSAQQLPRLNRILALKDLGLTLDQIARMLRDDVSDDEIQGMLLLQKAELEQSLADDLRRLRTIEARLQQNRMPEEAPDVVIKSVPAQSFMATRLTINSTEEAQRVVEQMQRLLPSRVGARNMGPMAAVFHSDSFAPSGGEVEMGFLLKKPVKGEIPLADDMVMQARELPAVATMATVIQPGDPALMFVAFAAIGRWIEVNGYCMAGPYREIVLETPDLTRLDEMVIEVQLPVARDESSFSLTQSMPV